MLPYGLAVVGTFYEDMVASKHTTPEIGQAHSGDATSSMAVRP